MSRAYNEISDKDLLQWMHWRDHDKLSMQEIGDRVGRPRNSIIGGLNRVNLALRIADDESPCAATKPENKDGGMKPLWWKK